MCCCRIPQLAGWAQLDVSPLARSPHFNAPMRGSPRAGSCQGLFLSSLAKVWAAKGGDS